MGAVTDPRPIPSTPEEYERSLAEITLGTPDRQSGPIELSDHDPEWAAIFREQAVRIRDALGSRAYRIEHVGSTAVPDLIASPRTSGPTSPSWPPWAMCCASASPAGLATGCCAGSARG
jgi:hypothetical protein